MERYTKVEEKEIGSGLLFN